jgi:hypothetical protein
VRALAAIALAAAALAVVGSAPQASAAPSIAYRFADARIDEASGIAAGVRSPGVDYVQNDSGDTARFFAVDAASGATAATVTVPGATNVDWEDLAVAPAPAGSAAAGRSSVWLADIGDNDAVRREIRVYRVDEPRIPAGARDRRVRTGPPDVWRLRYPNGATNAESFAVTPTGIGYVVTKSPVGGSTVYRLPARPDTARVQTLIRVGSIAFRAHATGIPLGVLGSLAATGAAISRDGSLLVVRTYADAYGWPVRNDDIAAALRRAPTRVALPVQPQGEGVAVDGDRLLVDSEGVRTAVYSVPLPASLTRAPPTPTHASTPTPGPVSSSPAADAAPAADTSTSHVRLLVGSVGVLLFVAAAVVLLRRRAR